MMIEIQNFVPNRFGLTMSMATVGICSIASTVAAQTVTTYHYDALGRLTESSVLNGSANGASTTYQFDAAGNRLRVKATVPSSPPVSPITIAQVTNHDFTQPAITAGAFQYGPMGGSGWYFSSSAGVQADGSAWGFPNAPDGDGRTAFLQGGAAHIVLNLSNLTPGARYVVKFKLSMRVGYPANTVYVAAANTNLGVHTPSSFGCQEFSTASFVPSGSSGTVYFEGQSNSGDTGTGIDDVRVVPAMP